DADTLVVTLTPDDAQDGQITFNDLTAQANGTDTQYYYRVYVNGTNGQKTASNIASIILLAGGGWEPPPPPATTANIAKIQYSLDQGETWLDYPTTPGAYITAEQNMTFGLRAVKDDEMLDWPFMKPSWQKQDDDDEMYGETVWLLFDTASTDSSDLKTVTVTCEDSMQINVEVM